MVVDTSVVIAVLKQEPECESLVAAVADDLDPKMSMSSALELHLVALGQGFRAEDVTTVLRRFRIRLVAFDEHQLELAKIAHDRYGRGSGSKARLNFGGCFSYALARHLGEPLMFVGDDFAATDIIRAR